ncbi:MAG: hypothetical protein JKY67_20730 [Pseudomonadales bacterium]|nr:hypothetical protein [Pseudomonadales bacterium]
MGVFWFVFLFGLIYWLIAGDIERYKHLIIISAMGKLGVYAIVVYLFSLELVTLLGVILATFNDFVMAFVFVYLYFAIKPSAVKSY